MNFRGFKMFLRDINPLAKLIASFILSISIVITGESFFLVSLYMVFVLSYICLKPPKNMNRMIAFITLIVMAGAILSQGFFYYFEPKTVLVEIFPWLKIYKEGLFYGFTQSFRMLNMFMFAVIMFMTTDYSDVLRALRRIGFHPKFIFAISLSFRFVPSFAEESRNIIIVQKLRGMSFKGIWPIIRSFKYLLPPLLISNMRKSRRMAMVAEMKGLVENDFPIKKKKFRFSDYAVLFAFFLILAAGTALK